MGSAGYLRVVRAEIRTGRSQLASARWVAAQWRAWAPARVEVLGGNGVDHKKRFLLDEHDRLSEYKL
jgi:hypothetical protein